MNLLGIYENLLDSFGRQGWWPVGKLDGLI